MLLQLETVRAVVCEEAEVEWAVDVAEEEAAVAVELDPMDSPWKHPNPHLQMKTVRIRAHPLQLIQLQTRAVRAP